LYKPSQSCSLIDSGVLFWISRKWKLNLHWSVLEKGMFSSSEQQLVGRECGTDTKNGCEGDFHHRCALIYINIHKLVLFSENIKEILTGSEGVCDIFTECAARGNNITQRSRPINGLFFTFLKFSLSLIEMTFSLKFIVRIFLRKTSNYNLFSTMFNS
jgi:hypothetical protein